jgi:hypothetical protein
MLKPVNVAYQFTIPGRSCQPQTHGRRRRRGGLDPPWWPPCPWQQPIMAASHSSATTMMGKLCLFSMPSLSAQPRWAARRATSKRGATVKSGTMKCGAAQRRCAAAAERERRRRGKVSSGEAARMFFPLR